MLGNANRHRLVAKYPEIANFTTNSIILLLIKTNIFIKKATFIKFIKIPLFWVINKVNIYNITLVEKNDDLYLNDIA